MKFPFEPKALFHKHGGRVLRIDRIAHECASPEDGHSRDVWFFVGAVEWKDSGKKSDPIEIAPWAICADQDDEAARAETNDLFAALHEYLSKNGKWNHQHKVHQGWFATNRPAKARRTA